MKKGKMIKGIKINDTNQSVLTVSYIRLQDFMQHMLRSVSIILLFMSFAIISNGQVAFNSVEDMWQYADAHNITIKTAKFELEKAILTKNQSYGSLLPQIGLSGSATYNNIIQTNVIEASSFPGAASGGVIVLHFGQPYVYAGTFNGQWDILNLQNIFNVQVSKRTEEMNKASIANTKKAVFQQIAIQYYSYLLMQEAARLSNISAKTTDSVYQSVNNRYKEGAVSEANLDIAKLNAERALQNQVNAQYQTQIARNNLKLLLGLSIGDSLDIQTKLENEYSVDEHKDFQPDPSIRLTMTQVKMARSQYKASNAAYAPTISIIYNNTTTQFDSVYRPGTNAVPWFPASYWSLRANLPIFTGGARYFQSRKSKINYEEYLEQYNSAVKEAVIHDENLRLSYQRAVMVLTKATNVMKLSFDNYQHISYKYEAGVTSIEDRLKAFSDYIDYQNAYLNSLSDMLVQLYQIKIRQQSF